MKLSLEPNSRHGWKAMPSNAVTSATLANVNFRGLKLTSAFAGATTPRPGIGASSGWYDFEPGRQEEEHGAATDPGFDAEPPATDEHANDRRQVRAAHPERRTREHRERQPVRASSSTATIAPTSSQPPSRQPPAAMDRWTMEQRRKGMRTG
uniref:Uncharacterized protein n=1 Tax=Oryza rufipogon TaxID=4529 RepID=A0A0E0QAT1_ORYRU